MPGGAAVVLMYHHVAEPDVDPGVLRVSPGHFAEQLQVLREHTRPLSLRRLTRDLLEGRVQPRSAVVTFDDGYRDNLLGALPSLRRFEVEATVFVAGGPSGTSEPFWWDELERLLLRPGRLPGHLEIDVSGRGFSHDLGGDAVYPPEAASRLRGWRSWEDPPTERHNMYGALRTLLVSMEHEEQRAVMEALRRWAGAGENREPAHARLSEDELLVLSSETLVDVGAHTVTHPMLSGLAPDRQAREIRGNRSWLEEVMGAPVRSFAYPFGDFAGETVGIVREAGFTSACTTAMGQVRSGCDQFLIPRHHVWDLDGNEFARWLHGLWGS